MSDVFGPMNVLNVGLSGLTGVHVGVQAAGEDLVAIAFISRHGSVSLVGNTDEARGLLTDALAQLDAIAAQHTEDEP